MINNVSVLKWSTSVRYWKETSSDNVAKPQQETVQAADSQPTGAGDSVADLQVFLWLSWYNFLDSQCPPSTRTRVTETQPFETLVFTFLREKGVLFAACAVLSPGLRSRVAAGQQHQSCLWRTVITSPHKGNLFSPGNLPQGPKSCSVVGSLCRPTHTRVAAFSCLTVNTTQYAHWCPGTDKNNDFHL